MVAARGAVPVAIACAVAAAACRCARSGTSPSLSPVWPPPSLSGGSRAAEHRAARLAPARVAPLCPSPVLCRRRPAAEPVAAGRPALGAHGAGLPARRSSPSWLCRAARLRAAACGSASSSPCSYRLPGGRPAARRRPRRPLVDVRPSEQLVLGAAVVATSATMAAALTLLGVIEATAGGWRSRCSAAPRCSPRTGLGTSAMLSGSSGPAIAVASSSSPGCAARPRGAPRPPGVPARDRRRRRPAAPPSWGSAAAPGDGRRGAVVGAVSLSGHGRARRHIAGMVCCVVLAAVHRWVYARDERRMAGRLRRSEAYFRSLVRSSGDAVVILDHGLHITWASPALERALGPAPPPS